MLRTLAARSTRPPRLRRWALVVLATCLTGGCNAQPTAESGSAKGSQPPRPAPDPIDVPDPPPDAGRDDSVAVSALTVTAQGDGTLLVSAVVAFGKHVDKQRAHISARATCEVKGRTLAAFAPMKVSYDQESGEDRRVATIAFGSPQPSSTPLTRCDVSVWHGRPIVDEIIERAQACLLDGRVEHKHCAQATFAVPAECTLAENAGRAIVASAPTASFDHDRSSTPPMTTLTVAVDVVRCSGNRPDAVLRTSASCDGAIDLLLRGSDESGTVDARLLTPGEGTRARWEKSFAMIKPRPTCEIIVRADQVAEDEDPDLLRFCARDRTSGAASVTLGACK